LRRGVHQDPVSFVPEQRRVVRRHNVGSPRTLALGGALRATDHPDIEEALCTTLTTYAALAVNEEVVALLTQEADKFSDVAGTFYADAVQPSRSPETMVRRDATLTMIFLGLREFQQMLDFCPSIDAQSPCAWARAMEAG
jgi:hypothetical protein